MNITTYTKLDMDPMAPRPEDIRLEDIAHALSLMTRANGHIRHFYSVAQHCISCAREAAARGWSPRLQLACLLHDASEAYLSDITRPVKIHLPEYKLAEAALQDVIFAHFGLSGLTPQELEQVHEIDDGMLFFEYLELMGGCKLFEQAPVFLTAPDLSLRDFSAVEEEFLSLCRALTAS